MHLLTWKRKVRRLLPMNWQTIHKREREWHHLCKSSYSLYWHTPILPQLSFKNPRLSCKKAMSVTLPVWLKQLYYLYSQTLYGLPDHKTLVCIECTSCLQQKAYKDTVLFPCHKCEGHQSHHPYCTHSYHSLEDYCYQGSSSHLYTLCMQDLARYPCSHIDPVMTSSTNLIN